MKPFETFCGIFDLHIGCYVVGTCDLLTNLLPAFTYQGNDQIFYIANVISGLTLILGVFLQSNVVVKIYLLYGLLFLVAFGFPLLLTPVVYPNVFSCPFLSGAWVFLIIRLLVSVVSFMIVYSYHIDSGAKA